MSSTQPIDRKLDGRSLWGLSNFELCFTDRQLLRHAAADALAPWLAGLQPWNLYVTLTYDPGRNGTPKQFEYYLKRPPSPDATRRHVRTWLNQAEDELNRTVCAVMVAEKQMNGWPHWHGLLATGGLSTAEFATVSTIWFSDHGYAKFQRVETPDREPILAYCGKYLTKTEAEILLWGPISGGALPGQTRLPNMPARET